MASEQDPRIRLMLTNLERAFQARSFHGTTLRGSLRGLKADAASWRPGPKGNSIWALILHAAYWKYIVRRHLTGDKTATFPRSPSNFPIPPDEETQAALKKDIRLLTDEHALLVQAVSAFPPHDLERPLTKTGPTPESLILGVAAHDLYHTGQIQLLKRLQARDAAV